MNRLDFHKFRMGTLFLIRTPETFPAGFAEAAFQDMKRLHLDYAAWLETWNCMDGILWVHKDYPRSSYWKDCSRDPLEEVFSAADQAGLAFLPECGVIHEGFVNSHPEAMLQTYEGKLERCGRMGLVPASPLAADFLIAKYDALIEKFGGHPSLQGLCMPAENAALLSYDQCTEAAYRKAFGTALPSPEMLKKDEALQDQVNHFLEEVFLQMYRRLARHLKQKHGLPLMHYPLSKVSGISHHEPNCYWPTRNLEIIDQVEEIDLLNLQLHPPLGNHPRQFKLEMELLEGTTRKPCVADTHWYHETNAGKIPDLAPKRAVDWIMSTLTPWGISFFCYGFMAKELPLWKKELNPGAPVYHCYTDPGTVAARRVNVERAMDFAEQLRPWLENTRHTAPAALFYRESLDRSYRYNSYCREHLFSLYEGIQSAALPLTVTDTIPEGPEKFRCLLFDAVKDFALEDAAKLRNYLAHGGRAIVIGPCAPALFDACALHVEKCAGRCVTASPSPEAPWSFSLPVDVEKLTAKGEILRAYENGKGAVVQTKNVVFVGCWAAISDFENMRQRGIVELWQELFQRLGGSDQPRFTGDYRGFTGQHEFVSCDLFETADGNRKVLLLRDFGVEVLSSRLEWPLPAGWQVVQTLLDGHSFEWQNGGKLPSFEYFVMLCAERVK